MMSVSFIFFLTFIFADFCPTQPQRTPFPPKKTRPVAIPEFLFYKKKFLHGVRFKKRKTKTKNKHNTIK